MLPSHFESSFQFQQFFSDTTHVSYLLFAISLAIVLLYVARHRSLAVDPKESLQILLYVITPASSLWPRKYSALARRAQSKILHIPLKMLIEGVISGDIELRSPENDIKRLLQGNGALQVKGWVLLFSFGHLWLSAIWWWMKSGLYAGSYKVCEIRSCSPLHICVFKVPTSRHFSTQNIIHNHPFQSPAKRTASENLCTRRHNPSVH